MHCANHPEVAALATCAVCGKALCPVCTHFYQGQPYCADHVPAPVLVPVLPVQGQGPPAVPPGTMMPGVPLASPYGPARLEPMAMEQRPGWSQEPLVRPPSGADTYGMVGTAVGVGSLLLAFCCGPFGVLGGLVAIVLGGVALAGARTARDPQQARTFGTISLVLGTIALIGAVAIIAIPFMGLFSGGRFP